MRQRDGLCGSGTCGLNHGPVNPRPGTVASSHIVQPVGVPERATFPRLQQAVKVKVSLEPAARLITGRDTFGSLLRTLKSN